MPKTKETEPTLAFGLREYPKTAKAVWGARFIFPDDLLWDRQDFYGKATPEGQKLLDWLNRQGNLNRAREQARKLSRGYRLTQDGSKTVILHEDETAIVKANPQQSGGYLYVCAYLK